MSVHGEFAEESNLSREEIEREIDLWIFSERDRMILKRRLLDGVLYKNLEDEFHLSERQLKRIVYKCEEKLFKKFMV